MRPATHIRAIQALLGHCSIRTACRYIHVSNTHLTETYLSSSSKSQSIKRSICPDHELNASRGK